jgi:translation initiation factor IF-3
LIDPDGQQLGIKSLPEALSIARSMELDLVEVAPEANPPVCRIMNFTKFKYEAQQRAKESRKKATNIVVKEMKYRPKIGGGDFETKTRKVAQFLGEGHKVKITIMFRGREMQHPELGRRILDRVAEEVAEVGKVEIMPKQDGRNMTMVLGPDKKAQELVKSNAKKASEAAAAAAESEAHAFDGAPEAPELVGTTATGALAPTDEPATDETSTDVPGDAEPDDGATSTSDEAPAASDEATTGSTETDTDERAAEPAVVGDKN